MNTGFAFRLNKFGIQTQATILKVKTPILEHGIQINYCLYMIQLNARDENIISYCEPMEPGK